MKPVLKVENLSYSYPAETSTVLKDISFYVKEKEFFSIIGPSGCGKTTLALTLNRLIPNSLSGKLEGEIVINGKNIKNITTADLSQTVQILFQSPESQLFALNVEDEISFGLENLNLSWSEIEKRVNEVLEKLKIEDLRNRSIEELSSGQKQKVALASVLAMKPKILILDEPTANLDYSSIADFVKMLQEIKKETTIILVEHNLDFIKELSDRVMLMDNGEIIAVGKPEEIFKSKGFLKIMNPIPDLRGLAKRIINKKGHENNKTLLEIKNLEFRYPNKVRALRNINLKVNRGDFLGIVGFNGSGKSTLALNIIGLLNGEGEILLEGKNIAKQGIYQRTRNIGYVFQNPNYQLFEDNVKEEVAFGLKNLNLQKDEVAKKTKEALRIINLEDYALEDPHSLSVGQKKRVTIASIVAMLPEIIIIDEPDTGLDYKTAERIMEHIKELNRRGHTIILISHNLSLIADYCNKVVYLENGEIKNLKNFFNLPASKDKIHYL